MHIAHILILIDTQVYFDIGHALNELIDNVQSVSNRVSNAREYYKNDAFNI